MLEGVGDLTCQLVATELMQTCLGHFLDLHGCRQVLNDRLFKNIFCSTSLAYVPTGFADPCFVFDGFVLVRLTLSTD